jgi:hypothetical protein
MKCSASLTIKKMTLKFHSQWLSLRKQAKIDAGENVWEKGMYISGATWKSVRRFLKKRTIL